MRILGIETSCDETSAAVVEETGDAARPWAIRSNVVASQVRDPSRVGRRRAGAGLAPAHPRHLRRGRARARRRRRTTGRDLGAVAVTQGPGLVGSLLVGVSFAKAAAAAAGLPLVAVHHLAGHIESLVLQNGELPLPAVVLVVSGGHTSLYLVERPAHYQLLSRTRDDAAGEAYDKVAKLLGLGYPGGPVIDRLAQDRQRSRDRAADDAADARRSQRARAQRRSRLQLQRPQDGGAAPRARRTETAPLSEQEIADIAASFQRVVVTALIERPFDAARRYRREERRRRRRRLGEQPAARRSAGARRAPRDADVPAEPGAVDRQRGDDRRRRPAQIPRRVTPRRSTSTPMRRWRSS